MASHQTLGDRVLSADRNPTWLFTENETNLERFGVGSNPTPYVKDGINDYVVQGRHDAVNPKNEGTKAAAHYDLSVQPGAAAVIRLRLAPIATSTPASSRPGPFTDFDTVMSARRREADEFYATVVPSSLDADAANVMRQALAGHALVQAVLQL